MGVWIRNQSDEYRPWSPSRWREEGLRKSAEENRRRIAFQDRMRQLDKAFGAMPDKADGRSNTMPDKADWRFDAILDKADRRFGATLDRAFAAMQEKIRVAFEKGGS